MWKDILKYILIATESSDKMSSFKNKQQTMKKVTQIDKWEDIITRLKEENEVINSIENRAAESAQKSDSDIKKIDYDEGII